MKRAVKMEENLEVRILEGDDKKWRSEAVTKQDPSGTSRRMREEKEKGKVF